MLAALPQFFLLLLVAIDGESFSPPANFVSPMHRVKRNSIILQSKTKNDHRPHGNQQSRRNDANAKQTAATPNLKRVPQNKRTAIRWVIQGVERRLSEEGAGNVNRGRGGNKYTYRRRADASLVDALYLMVNAGSQKDVLDAEKRLRVLTKRPGEFPAEVSERVIKATAMAGLSSLSSTLLRALLDDQGSGGGDLPSPMAYIAVLNALRKNGRLDRLEGTLADLAGACRRIARRTGRRVGVDVVAFNVHLAALCDAAVNGAPFSSAASVFDDGSDFNFTTLQNSSGVAAASVTTSSSEKYLYKALNLLKGDVARTRFSLSGDPDGYSYNSVLDAAARCSEPGGDNDHYARRVMSSCLRGMKERGIRPDVFTYNARIRAALASRDEEAAVRLVDELISDPGAEPDRYTIDFMLPPFLRAGRRDEVWSLLRDFVDENAGGGPEAGGGRTASSAFEAFLNTIVRETGEVDFAREVFESFFLPTKPARRSKQRMRMSGTIRVMDKDQPMSQQHKAKADEYLVDNPQSPSSRGHAEISKRLSPRTRHFNILFAGYSKAHLSAMSRYKNIWNNTTAIPVNMTESTVRNTQKAYKLLGAMLGIGVPLDGYSVTSLMSLPSTPENITSLLELIEPEMMVELNPAAYRSIISAYGKAGDPSSACWMFEEMVQSLGIQSRNAENWNVLLGALSRGCAVEANDTSNANDDDGNKNMLDVLNSTAARSRKDLLNQSNNDEPEKNMFISHVNRLSCLDASMTILDMMRSRTALEGVSVPKPNSQSYCLVASALSGYGIASKPDSDLALELFRNATKEGVAADGRFLNAVLRCFGDDIEGALAAWKSDIGPAAAAHERCAGTGKNNVKSGTNLMAAYNGLMHVCGRAVRPDAATRIAYAMNKANVDPTEATLNSYYAGKRVALGGNGDSSTKKLRLGNQYETLLSVECTKYNTMDKRRAKDRKIRIILSN